MDLRQKSSVGAPTRPLRKVKSKVRGVRPPWIFLVPALAFYTVVVIYPNLAGAGSAFTSWNGLDARPDFVGLANFRRLADDPQAVGAIVHTLLLTVTITVLQTVLGLVLALGLNSGIKSRNVLRTAFFAPAVLSPIVLAFLWQFILTPDGPLNTVIGSLPGDLPRPDWLGDPNIALWSIAGVVIWQHAGISMVIFLAGLQGVPPELYESAALDGANAWQRFRYVTLRLIAPATTIVLVFTLITALKLFDQIFAMTSGGPGYATETLSTLMYKQAFTLANYGYGTAIALVLTMFVGVLAFLQLRVLRRSEMA